MSRPLQSFHLAMAARLCVHALADRKAFAPQDLAALLITLDLVSHSAGGSPLEVSCPLSRKVLM